MTYELFDELVVEKCAVSVQNNEVILSLCKAEAKHWPRLLQDKYNKVSKCVYFALSINSVPY